jgi:hypothetical protein
LACCTVRCGFTEEREICASMSRCAGVMTVLEPHGSPSTKGCYICALI